MTARAEFYTNPDPIAVAKTCKADGLMSPRELADLFIWASEQLIEESERVSDCRTRRLFGDDKARVVCAEHRCARYEHAVNFLDDPENRATFALALTVLQDWRAAGSPVWTPEPAPRRKRKRAEGRSPAEVASP